METLKQASETAIASPKTTPAFQAASKILLAGIQQKASDIHVERFGDKPRIRFRVDGVLQEQPPFPPELYQDVIDRFKLMAGMNTAEKRCPQDGRIRLNIQGQDYDLRVSVNPYAGGESAVLRILSQKMVSLKLDAIGFSEGNLKTVRRWLKEPHGLVVSSGPTGSGKTTLLYTMVQEINTPRIKIITVEDPVEYLIDGVNQQQINESAGLTFGRALRAQLRQDPDVIMVGELRDQETAEIAIQCMLTGHLVLTTLHTNDAPEVIRRLLDIGIDPFLINSALTGVIAQRLIRLICTQCKEEYTPKDHVLEAIKKHAIKKFFRGKGCPQCHQTGYRGRTAIHEVLEPNDALGKLIARDAGTSELRRQAVADGMATLMEDGLAKAQAGLTTMEEVLRTCAGGHSG